MSPPGAASKTHRFFSGAEQGLGLVDTFLMFTFWHTVGHHASACLHKHFAIFYNGGAQNDACIHFAIGTKIAHTAAINATLVDFKAIDDFHGPHFWRTRY